MRLDTIFPEINEVLRRVLLSPGELPHNTIMAHAEFTKTPIVGQHQLSFEI